MTGERAAYEAEIEAFLERTYDREIAMQRTVHCATCKRVAVSIYRGRGQCRAHSTVVNAGSK